MESGDIVGIGVMMSVIRFLPPAVDTGLCQKITPVFADGWRRFRVGCVWLCGGFEESATIGRFFNLQEELTT